MSHTQKKELKELLVNILKGFVADHLSQDFVLGALNVQFEDDVVFHGKGFHDPLREVDDRDGLPIGKFPPSSC